MNVKLKDAHKGRIIALLFNAYIGKHGCTITMQPKGDTPKYIILPKKSSSTKNAPPLVAELPKLADIFIEHYKGRTILSDNILIDGL